MPTITGRTTTDRSSSATAPIPSPARTRSASASRCAGCAARISTWPRVISRCTGPTRFRDTRSSVWSIVSARARPASRSAPASVSRGCGTRVAGAGSAGGARRTSASIPDSRAGTPTAVSPSGRWSTRTSRTRSPTSSTTTRPRRCCPRASSATAPGAGPSSRRAVGWGSTGTAHRPISRRRSRSTPAPRSTC